MSLTTAEVSKATGGPIGYLRTALGRYAEYGWVHPVERRGVGIKSRWADWTPRMVRLALEVSTHSGSAEGKRRRAALLRQIADFLAADPATEWFFAEGGVVRPITDISEIPSIRDGGTLTTVFHLPLDRKGES